MNIEKHTMDWAIDSMTAAGHAIFRNDARPYNLNIVGIRGTSREVGHFDDTLVVFYWHRGVAHSRVFTITTDPGDFYMIERLLNPEGCAILAAGQYRGVYAIDHHNGQYPALCQRLGPVKVYRDGNRDNIMDFDPRKIRSGRYGINIHRSVTSGVARVVGRHSAGCQVFASAREFAEFMRLCYSARDNFGNRFTYTLLEESRGNKIIRAA